MILATHKRCQAICFALLLLLPIGCDRIASETGGSAVGTGASAGTVVLQIEGPGGTKRFEVADVADGTTLETVMRSCADIEADIGGSGTTAFVNRIGGIATNATEGWTFRVDGEWSDTGVGSTELHPPATVTWKFGGWDADSSEESNQSAPKKSDSGGGS